MSRARYLCTALAFFAAVSQSFAQQMNGQEIDDLVRGRKVFLSTPFGVRLPLTYRADGTVRGDISGISAARLFAPKETGKWWIQRNQLCQKWPSWYDGRQFCFKIERRGKHEISWIRDDGATGTARIE
jgi:hypothetical protein